jgi:hypothetical protein
VAEPVIAKAVEGEKVDTISRYCRGHVVG